MSDKTMTKKEAEKEFREEYIPIIDEVYGAGDVTARRTEWNNFTDTLHRGGRISDKQYDTWANPY